MFDLFTMNSANNTPSYTLVQTLTFLFSEIHVDSHQFIGGPFPKW